LRRSLAAALAPVAAQNYNPRMEPMLLPDVEHAEPKGPSAVNIAQLQAAGLPVPQIMHLFAFKPDRTQFLSRFTQGVMRGPSPLSPGLRELIAAFTSKRNDCLF
jgi:hypothetical protein